MEIMDLLVNRNDAESIFNDKKNDYSVLSISKNELDDYLKKGFEIVSELKTKFKIRKKKAQNVIFENKIWCTLYKMGYQYFNKDSHCDIPYADAPNCTKQIDVFAADEETVLVIECKSSETFQKNFPFKENLESYNGMKPGLIKYIRQTFPNRKIIFIYATNNYEVGEADLSRCKQFGLVHFNEDSVNYYSQLVEHLGPSAKYQLLGTLLRGQKIPSLNLNIPAIQGKMGGHKYYSFLIEPAKLLKIGFVLHRNNAYSTPDMMPTYQRLIKKERLKAIREFVNEGGYFPNSIIISIDTKDELVFDKASQNTESNISRMGTLHLPQVYQCAYIIDGQHRLYGYSESRFAETNTVPVIAFENLEKEEQVKMFMDINENQKPVPKTLRNTLEIDLLWGSKKEDQKRKAVMLSIAQQLGEQKKSPFYGRVITGENQKTPERALTLENFRLALYRSGFFNSYKNGALNEYGLFDFEDNNKSFDFIYDILVRYFDFIKTNFEIEWNKSEQGFLLTNNTICALILILADILSVEANKGNIKPKITPVKDMMQSVEGYFVGLISAMESFTESDIQFIKTQKGGSAPLECRKYIGWKLSQQVPEFNPGWLDEYIDNFCQNNHDESLEMMNKLLKDSKKLFINVLKELYGDKWESLGIPDDVYKKLSVALADQKRSDDLNNIESEHELLDFANFDDYRKICRHRSNWSSKFKTLLTTENVLFESSGDVVYSVIFVLYTRIQKNGNLSKVEFEQLSEFCNRISSLLK